MPLIKGSKGFSAKTCRGETTSGKSIGKRRGMSCHLTTQVSIRQLQGTLDTYFTNPTSLTIEAHFLQTTEHQSNQNNLQKPIKYRHVMCTVMFSLSDPPRVSNSCTPLDPILAKTCCDPTAVLKHVSSQFQICEAISEYLKSYSFLYSLQCSCKSQ